MFLLNQIFADYPVHCYNDQILGTWEIRMTKMNIKPNDDKIECPETITADKTIQITLTNPNIAIDNEGHTGVWSIVYNQAIDIIIGGNHYNFYLYFEEFYDKEQKKDRVHSFCNQSLKNQGWVRPDQLASPSHACMEAVLVSPQDPRIPLDNIHDHGEPGPVNPDADEYIKKYTPFLHPRPLAQPAPSGIHYLTLKKLGKLQTMKLKSSVPHGGDALPKNWDWRNVSGKSYVPKPFDQGGCGSCYACAVGYMFMCNVMVASNLTSPIGVTKKLSIQHAVDCNQYSQGCSGGFPEHVGRFAEDFGLLTTDEYIAEGSDPEYAGKDQKCKGGSFMSGDRYFFQAVTPMGGYSGAVTDPVEMQWWIYKHGAMSVSVNVEGNFGPDPYGPSHNNTLYNVSDPARHFFFTQVNHEVLVVGWKYDAVKDETFWIVQNSWGPFWNGDGTTLIHMGSNAYGIETYPVTAIWRQNVTQGKNTEQDLKDLKEELAVLQRKNEELSQKQAVPLVVSLVVLIVAMAAAIVGLSIGVCVSKRRNYQRVVTAEI